MADVVDTLLEAVRAKERRNRKLHWAVPVSFAVGSGLLLLVSYHFYSQEAFFLALAGVAAAGFSWGRDRPPSLDVSESEASVLIDRALPTKDRSAAYTELRQSIVDADKARQEYLRRQLLPILGPVREVSALAPLQLKRDRKRLLCAAGVFTLLALSLYAIRPLPPHERLAEDLRTILEQNPLLPTDVKEQVASLAERLSDGSSARDEIKEALQRSREALKSIETSSAGEGDSLELDAPSSAEDAERESADQGDLLPPTPTPSSREPKSPDSKRSAPRPNESANEKERQNPKASPPKEENLEKPPPDPQKEEPSSDQEKEGSKESQPAAQQQNEKQSEQKQKGGSGDSSKEKQQKGNESKESKGSKEQSDQKNDQGGEQGDGSGQGGSGSGEGKSKPSSDQQKEGGNSEGSSRAQGEKGADGKPQPGPAGGAAGESGAQSAEEQLEQKLSEIEKELGKEEGQQQDGPGSIEQKKGGSEDNPNESKGEQQKESKEAEQGKSGPGSSGAKDAKEGKQGDKGQDPKQENGEQGKEGSKGDQKSEKQKGTSSDKNQTKEGDDSGEKGKTKGKDSEGEEGKQEESSDSKSLPEPPGEQSTEAQKKNRPGEQHGKGNQPPPIDKNAKAREGEPDGGEGGDPGLGGGAKGYQDVQIKESTEQLDARFTGEKGTLEKTEKGSSTPKTSLDDVTLAKPKGSKEKGQQHIPLEYRDLLK